MMDLDSAIQHCKEQVQEQAKKGCYSCAEEHQQLAEWLKELKAYKEQDSVAISNLAMCHILNHEVKWINERMTREGVGRMNESEKERLIKKDIASIENRVRHAFNQGFEMGLKENKSEIPTSCGDAISREELIEALNTWDKFGYAPTHELIPLRGSADKDKYVPYIHYDDVIECIKGMPSVSPRPTQSDDAISRQAVDDAIYDYSRSCDANYQQIMEFIEKIPSVTPQQRTGHWIETAEEYYKAINEKGGGVDEDTPYFTDDIACSECLAKFSVIDNETERFIYCPNCGAKMEVEE